MTYLAEEIKEFYQELMRLNDDINRLETILDTDYPDWDCLNEDEYQEAKEIAGQVDDMLNSRDCLMAYGINELDSFLYDADKLTESAKAI